MSADTYIKTSGAWKKCKDIYVKNSGIWRKCKKVYSKVSGTWREVFRASEYTKDIFGDGSCLGLWRLDGSLVGEDGTPNSSMYNGNEAYVAGKSGQAFDLHNERIFKIGGIDYRDVKAWSFWVLNSTDFYIYISPNNEYTYTYIKCYSNSDILFVHLRAKHNTYNQAYLIVEGRVDNVITNHWYHIIVQWHYDNEHMYGTVYINGNINNNNSSYPIDYPYYGDALVGVYLEHNNDPVYSNGYIDHLRVFNRELSAAEIQTLYHELD